VVSSILKSIEFLTFDHSLRCQRFGRWLLASGCW
jgi:hypothetical protein